MNKTVIGCDIGNVIRNNIDSLPIVKSIEIINELSVDYEIIFISKCKPNYQLKCTEWLKENGLDKFKVYFCLEFYEKVNIATQNNVSIMIDDKIQVLSKFNNLTTKIWFCNDEKKINGTKKYQPDLFNTLKLANDWDEIHNIIINII
jgi:hypothetical protein